MPDQTCGGRRMKLGRLGMKGHLIRDGKRLILEINSEVALFRDLLIHVGQSRDCPELREKIRKLRRSCVEACKHTSALILPQIRHVQEDDQKRPIKPFTTETKTSLGHSVFVTPGNVTSSSSFGKVVEDILEHPNMSPVLI
ncbi:conserved hypothetical protein [Culex quinquefasciatus]|uniref:Syntaxin N-terminal domain-containing protein n=1 Tax=Culex quinquefasciatus TaxID=7176 RepID=B0WKW0_CULQU|nr:conserved hypothetical protein [Culex quinquefasciatus]|eukprot:XP_001849344.1 conserved hypothetical protein [Culex quinquefasciatus]